MTPEQRREATTSMLIDNAVTLAFTLVALVIMRKLQNPDFGRMVKMRVLHGVKKVAQNQADNWQTIADMAATSYHKVRM